MEAAESFPTAPVRTGPSEPGGVLLDSREVALTNRYAVQLRKALRCICCIVAVPSADTSFVFSIEFGSGVRKAQREEIISRARERLERGDTRLDPSVFSEFPILQSGVSVRVGTPSPLGVQVVLLAFGARKEKEAETIEEMKVMEEDLRVRIENVRLSDAVSRRNSILTELLKSVSGVNRQVSNLNDLMQTISSEARKLLRAETAAIYMPLDERCTEFALKACAGEAPEDSPELSQLFSKTFHEYEISRRKLMVEVGPQGEKLLLVPLIQRGSPQGILLLRSSGPLYFFTEDGLQTAELFGDWVSIALDNAVMFENVSKSQQEWENTFDSIFDPIYLIDPEYKLLKINKSLASYAMLPIKLPLNQYCYRYLFHRDSICSWCPVPRSLRTGQAVVVEAPVFTGGIWQIQSYPFTDKTDVRTGSINVLRDITLLKRIQEQLIESEKMASTGKLISGVAHEVRNPLFGISTTVRALANELGNKEDLKPFLDIVTSETTRLNRLMEELLNYSRPVKIDKNPSDIGEIIKEVLGRYNNVPGGKEVTTNLFGAENIPPINIDRNKIHQVLVNLVENGIQHSGDHPRVDIFLEFLSLSYPPEIHIVIKDYGSGISADILPRIFDPFFTTRSRGTGLGLSIVRKVVHDHGGRIAVESHPGVGTTFRIVLPVQAVE